MAGSFESLEEIRRNRSNVAVRCGFCEHRGVVDGGILWRWFALHHWDSRPTDVIEHMRCTICRRRPVEVAATLEAPTIEFGPRDETEWQEVVARLRHRPPRHPDW
ncbi:hypothetical protein CD928_22635 [Sphingopyxis sp. GW247-27LB]|nr:hypothetical protein CD928_22635 [Sphingopyxis sp. GW247-27LB]